MLILAAVVPGAGQKNKGEIAWDGKLEVESGNQSFGEDVHHAYTITIYDVKDNFVSGQWKDHIKEKGGKVSVKKGVASAEQASLPEIHSDPMDILTTFEEDKKSDAVKMNVAFVLDGQAVNPDDHPELHAKAEDAMYELSLSLNRAVVGEQVAEQEKALEKLEKDLESLKKENEKLKDDGDKNEKNRSKAESDQKKAESDLNSAKMELAAFEAEVGSGADAKQTKELAKKKKDIENLEKKIVNLKDDQVKYQKNIEDARSGIPKNEKAQEALMEQIAEQQEILAAYRQKLADVK